MAGGIPARSARSRTNGSGPRPARGRRVESVVRSRCRPLCALTVAGGSTGARCTRCARSRRPGRPATRRWESSPASNWLRSIKARCDPAMTSIPVGLVDRRQADADGESRAVQRVPAPLAVLVPGETDQTVHRVHPLDQTLGGDVAEVFAERVPGLVSVVEEPTDRQEGRAGQEFMQPGRLRHEVEDAARVASSLFRRRPPGHPSSGEAPSTAAARSASIAAISSSVNTCFSRRKPVSARKWAASGPD